MTRYKKNLRLALSDSLLKRRRTIVVLLLVVVITLPLQANAVKFGTIDTTHDYVGALVMKDFVPPLISPVVCTGSLVSPRVFLLAAHCIRNIEFFLGGFSTDRFFVSFANNVIEDTGSWKATVRAVMHPDYNPAFQGLPNDMNDYAAIILAQPVLDITPGTVAPLGYLDSLGGTGEQARAIFSIVGYGMDENYSIDGLRKVTYSPYQSLDKSWLFVSTNVHKGESGPCVHDSGSPALHTSGTIEYVVGTLTGHPSIGHYLPRQAPNMCNVGLEAYGRMDIPSAQQFIFGVIAESQ